MQAEAIPSEPQEHLQRKHFLVLCALWCVLFGASLFTPPLLDDADATHAQAARAILTSRDWVTLHVNGIRYLEKPPLPYWLVAISFRCFGFISFAAHLPGALAVLALALLGYTWARQSYSARTGLYTGLLTLTCTGVFLFTRVFIPDVLLSLLLALALYAFERALASERAGVSTRFAYLVWVSLALAILSKGLVVLVLFFTTAVLYMALTGNGKHWRALRPFTGTALFLAIAAPWHILASLRNLGGAGGHGFAWFYFINEHLLRFLGRRIPRDYNKLPGALYWLLHMVWLFPWSLFAPLACVVAYRDCKQRLTAASSSPTISHPGVLFRQAKTGTFSALPTSENTNLLLTLFSAIVLIFFSLSTNQEYYTFPAYLPLLMIVSACLQKAEHRYCQDSVLRAVLLTAHSVYAALGVAVSITLATALYGSRHYARPADIGSLLAHRAISHYTLSMASLFDLTGAAFAGLRLPAILALAAFLLGPGSALMLRLRRKHTQATLAVVLTQAVFLVAAHIALVRFAPMLSSKDFADRIQVLALTHQVEPGTEVLLFGDQAYGSSLAFYLNRQVKLVDGRTTSMYFGSTFADAPPVFLTPQQLLASWGNGPRKILFVPSERAGDAMRLLGPSGIVLAATSGKLLVTDRPLARVTR